MFKFSSTSPKILKVSALFDSKIDGSNANDPCIVGIVPVLVSASTLCEFKSEFHITKYETGIVMK